ncbi:MAG: hypothetical protein QOF12_353, partial [Solirubrobacteraceae bacterium]|nr:hypothetical protein [Solirubrobacteraceae bacterium]
MGCVEAAGSSAANSSVPPQRGQAPTSLRPSAIEALFHVRAQLVHLTAGESGSMHQIFVG